MMECLKKGKISKDFHTLSAKEDLYSYVRIEDIDKLDKAAKLERVRIISADGPANYMRTVLNSMDEETYKQFIEYHLANCERYELLGAAAHTLDILKK